jgi:hypothetical protein
VIGQLAQLGELLGGQRAAAPDALHEHEQREQLRGVGLGGRDRDLVPGDDVDVQFGDLGEGRPGVVGHGEGVRALLAGDPQHLAQVG